MPSMGDSCALLPNKVPSVIVCHNNESIWSTSVQMFIPFLLAGFGMVAASLLLDIVQVNYFIILYFSI